MIEGISFRTCYDSDRDWLFDLHAKTMAEYIAKTFGKWDDEFQRPLFEENFNPDVRRVIVCAGEDAGVVQIEDRPSTIWIANIQVHPRFQRMGIGARVIRSIIDDAERAGKSVTLRVFKVNPARRLYEKLGFEVSGENETHWYMERILTASNAPNFSNRRE